MKSLLQSQHDIFSNHQDETGHWESHENDITATMKLHNLQVEVWRKKGDSGLIRAHKWALFMVMWVNNAINHPPVITIFYRWYVYHSQSWVVYDIVLPALKSINWMVYHCLRSH